MTNEYGIPYFGESLALLTAITWAFAVILFKKSGEAVHPIGLNLFKCFLATVLFIPTMLIMGTDILHPASTRDYLVVMASGALGIGLADTLFFKSLNILGAGLSAIVSCLYSPTVIVLSMLWLNESMDLTQIAGLMLILGAVVAVTQEGKGNPVARRKLFIGIAYGFLGILCTGTGIVMVKPILDQAPLLWVIEWRLIAGTVFLVIVLAFHPSRVNILKSIRSSQRWGYTLLGSFMGCYVAMLLWLAGMKFTSASIAAVLNQTSNIFVFLFAALILKEPLNRIRIVAIGIGICGVLLVTFG